MKKLRVKHLEPIYIGYINQWMDALVTEDGSKFYSNDLAYNKSMDVMIQKLDEKDKELFHLMYELPPQFAKLIKRKIFYLSEKEFNDYCEKSLSYLETSDSDECRAVKLKIKTTKNQKKFHDWDELEDMIKPHHIQRDKDVRKIRENWKSRAASNGKGVEGHEFARTRAMLDLAVMNITRAVKQLRDLETHHYSNKGRKVILRMMCDKRVESYDEWEMLCEDIWEAFDAILEEEGREEEKRGILQKWRECDQQTDRRLATVKTFENFLKDLEIDTNRIILVPDIHFIRQWIELPLKLDYTCATILTPDGEEYYRPIQAQLRFFESLACDIDWQASYKKHPQKTQSMRKKVIELMVKCEDVPFHSPKDVELAINQITTDSFYAESKKKIMKTPSYMFQNKKYNDTMPMSQYRKLCAKYYHEQPPQGGSPIEMWEVRYFFLIRWIQVFLYNNKKLSTNLISAITMQVGIVHLKDAKEMYQYSTRIEMDRFMDYDRIKIFEKMAEKSRIKKLDHQKQEEPPKNNRKIKKPVYKKSRLITTKEEQKIDEKKSSETEDYILNKLAEYLRMITNSMKGGDEVHSLDDLIEALKSDATGCFDEEEQKIYIEIARDPNHIDKLIDKLRKFYEFEIRKTCYYKKKKTVDVDISESEMLQIHENMERMTNYVPPNEEIYNFFFEKLKIRLQDPNAFESSMRFFEEVEKLEDLKSCQDCDEKEKKFNNEIESLKRQLAEKSKLLEDRENRVQSDGMRLHEMQKKLEEANKLVAQHEQTIKGMEKSSRTQTNKIKEDSKREIQELKEKLTDKDKRFKQLEMELKEIRENAKNEQNQKNSKENDESRIADKDMKKVKAELEMAKFTEKTNSKKIDKLEKDNRDLQIQLELLKEQNGTNSIILQKDERIRELIEQCDNLKLENIGLSADVEELSVKNLELLVEIDRLNNVLLEDETNVCQPSTSSKHAPIAQLQNQLEDIENNGEKASFSLQNQENNLDTRDCLICRQEMDDDDRNIAQCEECQAEYHQPCLSQWLEVNSTCPSCRNHWPDPQEFPAL